jgi:hypothetical protein
VRGEGALMPDDDKTSSAGFMGLREAFEKAFETLHDASALGAGLLRSGLTHREEAAARGLTDLDEYPNDYPGSDPEAERAITAAIYDVELFLRAALAKSEFKYECHDHEGRVRRCVNRRAWVERKSPPDLGMDDQIHNATCPGPPELEGCFVTVHVIGFETCLQKELQLRKVAERQAQSASAEPEQALAPSEGPQATGSERKPQTRSKFKLDPTIAAMRKDIDEGKLTRKALRAMPPKKLAFEYGNVSRATAQKARDQVLLELVNRR